MDKAKKIAIVIFAVAMVALGVAVVYAYNVSSNGSGFYGYGGASSYGNTAPYGGYGYYSGSPNNGGYFGQNSYGQGHGMMGGCFGMGMRYP